MATRAADLIANIQASYDLVRDYERRIPLALTPKERARFQLELEEQKDLIAGYGRELTALAAPVPRDIVEILAGIGIVSTLPAGLMPLPPDPCFAHPYPLQEGFTGRVAERQLLTAWLAADPAHPVLALVALGGMGKSALTWAWALRDLLNLPLPGAPAEDCDPDCRVPEAARPQGLLWWSFYEQSAGFGAFLEEALAYASGGEVDPAAVPAVHDRVRLLVRLLQERPILLVLDGFERALRAYAGMGAAYQGNEDAPPECEGPRACTDPHAGDFLRSIASLPLCGRVLLTTRLLPRALDGLAGARAVPLEAFSPDDAAAFFHRLGVRGTAAEVQEAAAPYGYHPLALRLLAGLAAGAGGGRGDCPLGAIAGPVVAARGVGQHGGLERAVARRPG